MHTLDVNTSNVPAFLIKLWKLVEDPSCDDLIAWSDNGASFIIKDQAKFARELLPQYFKHNNMASFVRQLNMYGFRKVMNYEKSGLRNENNEMEFQHTFFVREQSELLELIKRKIPSTRVVAETLVKSNPKDILTDLTSIRDKQESMDNMLMKMKHENELLWKELTNMRQKHKQQEQVIEKVINFLVQVMQNQPLGVGIQRKMLRRLHDSPSSKGSTSQITTIVQKEPECIIVQEKNSNGPVIHEVTDMDIEEPQGSSAQSPIVTVKSPAPKSKSKSPAPHIVVFSPVDKSSKNKDGESGNLINQYPLNTSSLNSPINSAMPMEPLNILDPLQTRTPVGNEEETDGEDSLLGIPLEYITANDVASSMNIVTADNVISIPEDNIVCNVISIPEGTEISNVISIPAGSNISDIISASSNSSSMNTNTSTNTSVNLNSISEATINSNEVSADAEKNDDSVTIPDFYDLHPDSVINIKSPLDLSLVNHAYEDPLMSDSLQTPKIPLADDLGLTEFTIVDDKKLEDSGKESSPSSPVSITQREHDYPATISNSSSLGNSSSLNKNALSNHLLTVEEHLTRLQDHIETNTWDVDADKLLGVCHSWETTNFPQLFSSDGMVSNDSFVNQLTDSVTVKKEPDEILGNELIQFTPQLLGVELDDLRSPFLNQLDPDVLDSSDMSEEIHDKSMDLLKKELTDTTDQDTNSQSAEILSNDTLDNFPNKRCKLMKPPKNKSKRKLK